MNDFDIPIFKKTYDLYRTFHSHRQNIAKQDRYTIWQRSENILIEILEQFLFATQSYKLEKRSILETVSVKLNLLRVFTRLMKDTKVINNHQYIAIENSVDEIGRMLGGWLRSVKEKPL